MKPSGPFSVAQGAGASRWRCVLSGLLLVLLSLAGCAPRPTPPLWLVQDEDTRVWLLGSVHVLEPGLDWRSPQLRRAWALADLLVLETALDPAGAAALATEAARVQSLPPGRSLGDLLSAPELQRLQRQAARLGLTMQQLDTLRPHAAAMRLMAAQAASLGQSPLAGVESTLLREAQARRLPMRGLESARAQVQTLAGLSAPAELQLLRSQLEELETDPQAKRRLDQLWLRGDLAALDREVAEGFADQPELRAALLGVRNRRFAAAVQTLLARDRGDVLVVIGAAHFVGEDAVPVLLQREGLQVRRR